MALVPPPLLEPVPNPKVGAAVYPNPELVTVILVTCPFDPTTAVAVGRHPTGKAAVAGVGDVPVGALTVIEGKVSQRAEPVVIQTTDTTLPPATVAVKVGIVGAPLALASLPAVSERLIEAEAPRM